MRGSINEKRRDELIERFDLDPRKKARTYSKGNCQKVALISDVRLLLLDEPTSGLDPLMEQVFRGVRARGAAARRHGPAVQPYFVRGRNTVRPGDHYPGRSVESGALLELRHLSRTSITAELVGDLGDHSHIPGVEDLEPNGHTLRCQVDSEHLGELIRVLGEAGVRSLTSAPPTLEELFLRYYLVDGETAESAGEKVQA
jgi:ABC-2 type transport system ATP-binding protein